MENIVELDPKMAERINANMAFIEYISGTVEGKDYWAYLMIRPADYVDYQRLVQENQAIELSDFGAIMAEGFDNEPPEEIKQKIQEIYFIPQQLNEKLSSLGNTAMEFYKEI